MSTIDEQFVEFVVKSLVNHPDDVQIERTIDKLGVLIKLTVNPEDLGRVIGKRGATAQSMRTLLRALGTKNEARYNLKIVDNGDPRPDREERHEEPTTDEKPVEKKVEKAEEVADEEKPAKKEVEKVAEPKLAEKEVEKVTKPKPASTEPVVEKPAKVEEPAEEEETESIAQRTMDELKDLDDLEL